MIVTVALVLSHTPEHNKYRDILYVNTGDVSSVKPLPIDHIHEVVDVHDTLSCIAVGVVIVGIDSAPYPLVMYALIPPNVGLDAVPEYCNIRVS